MRKLKGDMLIWIAILVIIIALIVCIFKYEKIENFIDNSDEKQKTETILDHFMSGQ